MFFIYSSFLAVLLLGSSAFSQTAAGPSSEPSATPSSAPVKPLPLSSRKRAVKKPAPSAISGPVSGATKDTTPPAPARASDPEVAPKTQSLEPARQGEEAVPPFTNPTVTAPTDSEANVAADVAAEGGGADETPAVAEAPPHLRKFNISATGMLLSLPIPFKYGVSLSYVQSPKWRFEGTYLSGAYEIDNRFISLGGFREALITVNARRFIGRSFNFIMGLSSQQYAANVGLEIASRSTGVSQYDLLSTQTLGAQLGLSNIFMVKGFTFGIDWLVLNVPFYTVKSEAPALQKIANGNDRGTIDAALKYMRYIPTGALAKISLGYSL